MSKIPGWCKHSIQAVANFDHIAAARHIGAAGWYGNSSVYLSTLLVGSSALIMLICIDGREIKRGKDFRFGHSRRLEGSDLVVWIKAESTRPIRVTLSSIGR